MDPHCYRCKEDRSKSTCGKCRKITKSELVEFMFDPDNPVYLHEGNRHKSGQKKTHTNMTRRSIAYKHKMGRSFRDIANEYGVSSTTIFRYYNQFKHNWE